MAPSYRHNDRNGGQPYQHQERFPPHNSHRGGRQDSSRNHGGHGRGGQGWHHHNHRHYGLGSNPSHGNQARYTNNRPDPGRARNVDEQARAERHDNDGRVPPSERSVARDMVEPQLETSGVKSEQKDDGNVAPPDESENPDTSGTPSAFAKEQNDDEDFDPNIPFEKMNYMQKLFAQIPISEDEWQFKRNMKLKIFENKRIEERKQSIVAEMEKKLWEEREAEMKIAALEEIEDEDEKEEREMDELEHPGAGNFERNRAFDYETKRIGKFILALPSCLLLTAGFCAWEEGFRCFCPCSVKAGNWRKLANCDIDDNKVCKKGDFPDPNALMDHLGSKTDKCIMHVKVEKYLKTLFSDYWTRNLSHKGLYKKGSRDYDKALAFEKQQSSAYTNYLKRALEELKEQAAKERKLKEQKEVLKEVSPDQEEILNLPFNIESPKPSLNNMLLHFEKQLVAFWSMFKVSREKEAARRIEVKQDFSLQEEFEKWHKSDRSKFPYIFLFQDTERLRDSDVRKLLSRPKIDYAVNDALQSLTAKVKKEDQAVDEGGPEIQFFSQVWQMMPKLKVSTPDGSKSIQLFEYSKGGYLPATNDKFVPEVQEQARLYYRALGRLFVNCLCMRRTIPDEVLPAIFRNAIMRDCMPTSPDYCVKALCIDMHAIGWSKESLQYLKDEDDEFRKDKKDDEQDKEVEEGTYFRKVVLERCFHERSLWFESFKEGVTLKARVPISVIYSLIPLHAVNSLTFGTQKFTAHDVIDRIRAKYKGDSILQESQKLLFDNESKTGTLSDLLIHFEKEDDDDEKMKSEEEQDEKKRPLLQRFVEYCTGQHYLPRDVKDFTINVVFETRYHEKCSTHEDRLPVAYTCINQLSLPLQAYDGSREKLEERLNWCLEGSDVFSMH